MFSKKVFFLMMSLTQTIQDVPCDLRYGGIVTVQTMPPFHGRRDKDGAGKFGFVDDHRGS